MAEQTFRSPGFFDQEIDISGQQVSTSGIPAGIIGTAEKGPAFVPVTVGSFADFQTKFGTLDARRFGPYAVKEWLENRTALTYVRLLGAGANESASDIASTIGSGFVKNAGFRITGSVSSDVSRPGNQGSVQFIVAKHNAQADEINGFPMFTDNGSIGNADAMFLVRGAVLLATGTRMMAMDNTGSYETQGNGDHNAALVGAIANSPLDQTKYFKLILSSSTGKNWSYNESQDGIRILTASLDPNDANYISNILNTDPLKFQEEEHLLYLDYAVEHDLAPVISDAALATVAVVSGSSNKSTSAGTAVEFLQVFGRYDSRYTTPQTTDFISQPFGDAEYSLFRFETLDDGAYANDKFKISIAGLRASTNKKQPFGTFEVQLRAFDDSDTSSAIIERFPNCSLDPTSDRYIARLIGDKKVRFDWDQETPEERRLVISGKYPNVSQRIRIVMNEQVDLGQVPKEVLPFGFKGVPVLKTNDSLTDGMSALAGLNGETLGDTSPGRLALYHTSSVNVRSTTGSIVPPMPLRVKVTRGPVLGTGPVFLGDPGSTERVDGRFYWGIKTDPIPVSSSNDATLGKENAALRANEGAGINPLVRAYTKFQGIAKMDSLVTGTGADFFNDNKFTLARVALYNAASQLSDVPTEVTGTAGEHMLQAAYVRNGRPNPSTYTVTDGVRADRVTMASLIATSSALFNRFTSFNKFTNVFYGGFDGVNILDEDQSFFRDRALSTDTGGKAQKAPAAADRIGLALIGTANQAGGARLNNNVASIRSAVDIITNPVTSRINLLAIPGAREAFVTDYASEAVKSYGLALYLMDPIEYDKSSNRLYDDSAAKSDVTKTISLFETRTIDNNYVATYFPDVTIVDSINNRVVQVPPSVAAMGALGFNDKTQQVWFAPAGFNRGALDFVTNVENRLSANDRDSLYDAKINPIATFPRAGFVIFGQKTLQVAQTALNRINARRMLIDIKRQIGAIAARLTFEQNTPEVRASFVAEAIQALTFVQARQGIEKFRVICDDSNNPPELVEQNQLKGSVQVVPTRAIEFISVDFIITNNGVSFE
jgi:hypothetical protein